MSDQRDRARDLFRGVVAMAPMATGGNLPYRRLCREYGAELTCSEMVVAEKLVRGNRGELRLLRHHPTESPFGIQLCGRSPEILVEAVRQAEAAGCDFIDLNFGCPIDLIVRRGGGAALLKRPAKLGRLVAAARAATELPLLVKLRSGWSEKQVNASETARVAEEEGADGLVLHGRTREQHYRRSADWDLIRRIAAERGIPVIGNGDILNHWDLERQVDGSRVAAVMVARGALIKPWIFRELKERRPLPHDPAGRWEMMRRYLQLAREHFGDDERGLAGCKRFFIWHLGFWHRYRPHTREQFEAAWPAPLLQTRDEPVGGDGEAALLASGDPADHERIWQRALAELD